MITPTLAGRAWHFVYKLHHIQRLSREDLTRIVESNVQKIEI